MAARTAKKIATNWTPPNPLGRPTAETPVVLRPTRPGTRVPLFGEDFWNLACVDHSENKSPPSLTFDFIDPHFQQIAKELMWQRLNVPVASLRRQGARVWTGETCERAFNGLRQFIHFMTQWEIPRLADVGPEDIDNFLYVVQAGGTSTQHQAAILKVVDLLYESREHLTGGGLTFAPWPGMSTERLVKHQRAEENATPRIPEHILGPLLAWALTYIDHFAADIINADRFHRASEGTQLIGDQASAALADYIAREVQGRGVPATRPNRNRGELTPAYHLIARRSGVGMPWLRTTGRRQLEGAIDAHGLDEHFLPRPTFRFEGAGDAWHPGMGVAEMVEECRHLTVACYVVCAYLSGMRDGEVQALERECLKPIREADGTVIRWTVEGLTFKGEQQPKRVSWVVIEPVARAIEVLKALTAPLRPEKFVFVRLHTPSQSNRLIKEQMSSEIREFARHCNEVLAPRLPNETVRIPTTFAGREKAYELRSIPDGEDGPWNFTTMQFRRTMAWHIANRPMGVIAGMIQYKHASIQMFEGYAGVSKSEFRAEIEQEEAAAKREDIVSRYDDYVMGMLPAGPMGRELKAMFAHIAKEIGPTPLRIVDNTRVDKLVRNLSAQLYPGVLADCFYVPSRARCQMTTEPELRTAPVPTLCDPECPSACWTHKHLDTWKDLRDENRRLRSLNRVSPEQRDVFDGMDERIERRITKIEEAKRGKSQD